MTTPAAAAARRLRWAGFLLGLSLGGFFDGILLHQVLQWHHLLSNVQATALQDVRAQLAADGLFHLLMYLLAGWALYLLWRARVAYADAGADRLLWSLALVGFGLWHVLDAVFSHWITGIHRIRVDATDPLFWDLLWLAVFGLLPLALGCWWHRRGPRSGAGGGRRAAQTLALAAIVAGPVAALPAGDDGQALVLFRPGVSAAAAFEAIGAADARVLWVDRSGGLFALQLGPDARAAELYRRGALLVSTSAYAAGCFAWSKPGA